MSLFPSEFKAEGYDWKLIYDPSSSTAILPDFHAKIVNLNGQWVSYIDANSKKWDLYMVTIDLEYPSYSGSNGVSRPGRLLRGIRLYNEEVNPEHANPEEMFMYAREVKDEKYNAQTFLDCLFDNSPVQEKKKVDRNWADSIFNSVDGYDSDVPSSEEEVG